MQTVYMIVMFSVITTPPLKVVICKFYFVQKKKIYDGLVLQYFIKNVKHWFFPYQLKDANFDSICYGYVMGTMPLGSAFRLSFN